MLERKIGHELHHNNHNDENSLVAVLTDERPRWAQSETASALAVPPLPTLRAPEAFEFLASKTSVQRKSLIEGTTSTQMTVDRMSNGFQLASTIHETDDAAHLADILLLSANENMTASETQRLMLETIQKMINSNMSSDREIGSIVREAVVKVLPALLDGTRSMDELCYELGMAYEPLAEIIKKHFPDTLWL